MKKYLLIISIIIFIISLFLLYKSNNIKPIHAEDVILTEQQNIYTYVDIDTIPYLFGGYDNITDSYYFVTDGDYVYIAYMSDEDFNKFSEHNHEITLTGYTRTITEDTKLVAIDAYNELVEDENNYLTEDTFSNIFGFVLIDFTIKKPNYIFIFSIILLVISIIIFIIYLMGGIKHEKNNS